MLMETDPCVAVTVRKLVMVSLMEIFKDIVPSYRIRPLTEAEKSTKVRVKQNTSETVALKIEVKINDGRNSDGLTSRSVCRTSPSVPSITSGSSTVLFSSILASDWLDGFFIIDLFCLFADIEPAWITFTK